MNATFFAVSSGFGFHSKHFFHFYLPRVLFVVQGNTATKKFTVAEYG